MNVLTILSHYFIVAGNFGESNKHSTLQHTLTAGNIQTHGNNILNKHTEFKSYILCEHTHIYTHARTHNDVVTNGGASLKTEWTALLMAASEARNEQKLES